MEISPKQLVKKLNRAIGLLTDLADVILAEDDVALSPESQQRVNRLTKDNKCLYCGDPMGDDKKPQRGCHNSCYHAMFDSDTPLFIWQQRGMLGPKSKPGRKPRRKALLEKGEAISHEKKKGQMSVGRAARGKTEK